MAQMTPLLASKILDIKFDNTLTKEKLSKSFKKLALTTHPDKTKYPENANAAKRKRLFDAQNKKFAKIYEAYQKLKEYLDQSIVVPPILSDIQPKEVPYKYFVDFDGMEMISPISSYRYVRAGDPSRDTPKRFAGGFKARTLEEFKDKCETIFRY